jgi:hypothetical protein
MGDSFVTFVAIQPSASVQLESQSDSDVLTTSRMKHGLFGKKRRDIIHHEASEACEVPLLPRDIVLTVGEEQITLAWPGVAGATSYDLYWSDSPGVTKSSTRITGAVSGYVHSGLDSSKTYYYALATVGENGEGPLGTEVSATPWVRIAVQPLLAPVVGTFRDPGTAPPTLSVAWSRYDVRASLFNIYWGTSPGITKGSTKIANLSTYSYVLTGLDYGTTYYLAASLVGATEESALSLEVSATTNAYAFTLTTASGSTTATNTITFGTYKADTLSFNVYWSLTPGVTKSSNKITGAVSPYYHTALICERTYYYAIAAVSSNGEGALCPERSVTTPKANPMPLGHVLWLDANDPLSWPGSGTQWKDLSGNGYHVNGVSTANFVTEPSTGGTVYRGSGSAMHTVSGLTLNQPCTVLTIARYNGLGSNNRGRVVGSASTNWLLGWHGGRAGVFYSAGWVANTGTTYDNSWYCAVGTCKSGDYHFYNNGVETTESFTGGSAGPGTVTIGGYQGGEFSNCDVVMVIAWNRVLTTSECTQAFQALSSRAPMWGNADPAADPSTRLLYRFETSPSLYDQMRQLDLYATGTPVLSVGGGRLGSNCWDSNKAGHAYAALSNYGAKNLFCGDITVEGWLYYDAARSGTFPEWFLYAGTSNATYGRYITAFLDWTSAYGGYKKIVWLMYPGGDVQVAGADTIPNAWNHFAFRRKYDTAIGNWLNEVWQNGVYVGSIRSASGYTSHPYSLYLGCSYGGASFVGKLDTVRFSNRYRTDDELRWFFNNT